MVTKEIGKLVSPTKDIYDLFKPVEGFNSVYYGKVRNGKTRTATADIHELLQRGEVVYANWKIDFDPYDERDSFWVALVSFFTGRKFFYRFDASNFHYFHPDDIDVDFLGKLVGVHLFIDEGQWIFNSHVRHNADDPEMIAKRKLVLHGGHYCRSLNVITQRPSNILKDIRSQVHFWHRCVKRFDRFGLMIFQRFTIEDMIDDLPVEFDAEGRPLGELKTYWVNKRHDKIFKSYNTHAMRDKDSIFQVPKFDVFYLSFFDRFRLLFRSFFRRKPVHLAPARREPENEIVGRKLKVKYENI